MKGWGDATIVKKYSNRRLYDTGESRYITLDELAQKIRSGTDVRVIDAKTNEDLTQVTLTQIILESRRAARLLPIPLLVQLIRMGDDALAEFLGRYMSWALEMYMHAKQGAQAIAPYNPFATVPFTAINSLARLFNVPGGGAGWQEPPPPPPVSPQGPPPPPDVDVEPENGHEDIAALRREMEELKQALSKMKQ